MFERRLKIFLSILLVFVLVLLARAMQLQVVERDFWSRQASLTMRKEKPIETSRGRILDYKGAVLAEDQPCIDACIDYRAILDPPDPVWVTEQALGRIREKYGDQYKSASSIRRKQMLKEESDLLVAQINLMWEKLARLSGKPIGELMELRKSICERIELRRKVVALKRWKTLQNRAANTNPPWYRKWLLGEQPDVPELQELAGEIIGEEQSAHVILEAIDHIVTPDGTSLQNELQKHADEYPALKLIPNTHRVYPFGAAACHVIGHLGKVQREDLANDPDLGDDLRGYKPNDVKGRDGLEALGEPTLRGARGETVFDGITGQVESTTSPIPGDDFVSTLDIDLQMQLQEMFTRVAVPYETKEKPEKWPTYPMHGAAVVMEIATGDVRALVSYPDYDLNKLDQEYRTLAADSNLERPLLNRATQAKFEPGSTVKPIVGAGAITDHVLRVNEGIECTGYLVIGGKRITLSNKCWTVALGKANQVDFVHHPFPWTSPHRGHDGNPDGFLTYADAIERSCNVFFETVADRLTLDGVSAWMERFGIGRPTGIGIGEVCGRLPTSYVGPRRQSATWTAGIGQGPVAATPLQMCNVAATIARRGIWLRPNLITPGQKASPFKPKKIAPGDSSWDEIPSRLDLHIDPAAIDAAIDGMKRVVNSPAGTGTVAFRSDIMVAAKTGTVQAAPMLVPMEENGERKMVALTPSTETHPYPDHLWYRASDEEGKKLNHAWFIGFVPANQPRFAISVMVEYGGGGGGAVAGPIAKEIIEALVEHGYLHKGK